MIYNIYLFRIIQRNKININYHEQSVQKKEVEYVYGINDLWNDEQYYTFSSFRSGFFNIYHRVFFNLYAMFMIAIDASGFKRDLDER